VDIRPTSTDGNLNAGVTVDSDNYDRSGTERLMKLLLDNGAKYILFGDEKLVKKLRKEKYQNIYYDKKGKHNDHIHARF
jgi:hypothetical protein